MGPNETQASEADVQFSRSLLGGKKTSELKFRVSDELHDGAVRRARELGFQTVSEYLEHLLAVNVIGKHKVASFLLERLNGVDQASHEAAQ